MTSASGGSRISGLSDFPAPPPNLDLTPAHMSLLGSYFDEPAEPVVDAEEFRAPNPKRGTFGLDENESIHNRFSAQ
ncbi:hypothetical protein BD626DRAFT_409915 [Schizophyllum amplum]|uniref:Uncharacterized protein n=1 Tax=Schizophyllum amplum TaxID=97359 RepID=A0A550C213_9AGAR|nr:hypothetical protein BD626DRAFT_409915 [Auriculariopsis ampla]